MLSLCVGSREVPHVRQWDTQLCLSPGRKESTMHKRPINNDVDNKKWYRNQGRTPTRKSRMMIFPARYLRLIYLNAHNASLCEVRHVTSSKLSEFHTDLNMKVRIASEF